MRTSAVDDGPVWWRAEPAESSTTARRQVLYLSGQLAPPAGRPRGHRARRNWIICRPRQVRQNTTAQPLVIGSAQGKSFSRNAL
jgi:hypothetical protein